MHSEQDTTHSGELDRRQFKRLGFAMLGLAGTVYGAESLLLGAGSVASAPLLGTVALAVGAGLVYGGYKGFQKERQLATGVEHSSDREVKLSRIARYLGGAALIVGGAVVTGVAIESAVGAAITVGVLVGGVSAMAWGVHKIRDSFSTAVPTDTEPIDAGVIATA